MKLTLDQSANPARLKSVKLINKAIKIGRIEKTKSKIIAGEIKKYGAFLFADFITFFILSKTNLCYIKPV